MDPEAFECWTCGKPKASVPHPLGILWRKKGDKGSPLIPALLCSSCARLGSISRRGSAQFRAVPIVASFTNGS